MATVPRSGLRTDDAGITRCWWCGDDPQYSRYHDEQWGFPVDEDRRLFEKICLEGFQSGLSWLTILRKRENFRKAFANFEIAKVARFRAGKVETLLKNAGIRKLTLKALRAMTTSDQSKAMSKDLKRRGWSYVGPTTIYSFMQSVGIVNDHIEGCATRDEVERARARFRRPS